MANGNGNQVLEQCGGMLEEQVIHTEIRPFTIFAGSVPFFNNGGATVATFIVPNLALILPADPSRIGLYIKCNRNGVVFAVSDRGVSITNTLYDSNGNVFQQGQWVSVGRQVFLQNAIYAAHVDVAPFVATETIIQGFSLVKL